MRNIIEFLHDGVIVTFCSILTVALIYGFALMIWILFFISFFFFFFCFFILFFFFFPAIDQPD